MARLRPDDFTLKGRGDGSVTMRIKERTHVIEASDLHRLSTILGNAAVDEATEQARFPIVQDIHLKPFDETGNAFLRLELSAGPIIVSINHNLLQALAASAAAALEHSAPGGSA